MKFSFQTHVLICNGKNAAGNGQNISHAVNRFVERAGNAVHRRQKQIAKTLPGKASVSKAVIEQLLHGWFRVGKRHDAVADITRWKHAEILPEHTGAAAVVRYGDDGCNILRIGFQTPQHGG